MVDTTSPETRHKGTSPTTAPSVRESITLNRDATSGQFVDDDEVAERPGNTTVETRPMYRCGAPISGRYCRAIVSGPGERCRHHVTVGQQ